MSLYNDLTIVGLLSNNNEEMSIAREILQNEIISNEEVIVELDNGDRRRAPVSAAPINAF